MFEKEECFLVGSITRTHGINGNVIVRFERDDAYEYELLESVFVEIRSKLVPFFVSNIKISNDSTAIVGFEDVDTEIKAKEVLVGHSLFLPMTEMVEDTTEFNPERYIGYRFSDNISGASGVLNDVIKYPQHAVYEATIKNETVLIPAAKDLMITVDETERQITFALPEGLFEL